MNRLQAESVIKDGKIYDTFLLDYYGELCRVLDVAHGDNIYRFFRQTDGKLFPGDSREIDCQEN